MQITDFLQAKPYTQLNRDALVREIVGVTALHVEGVIALGEPKQLAEATEGTPPDPGLGVGVHSWNGDLWIYVVAVVEGGINEKRVKKEISGRVQAALLNLLDFQAVSIQVELLYADGTPAGVNRGAQLVPFS